MSAEHPPRPQAAADSGAIAVMGLDLNEEQHVKRSTIFSWAIWDWATQPFNTVILTFIFSALYLTTDAFIDPEIAALGSGDPRYESAIGDLAAGYGLTATIAGLVVLAIAPALGQQADAAGRRKLWLGIGTGGLIVSMLLLWFVEPAPALFWLGASLIAAGQVFGEIATVNSNALLIGIANPKNIGRISGLGWGLGYIGGVVALVIVIVFYIADWFGLSEDGGLPFRIIALACALWAIGFSIPVFLAVPEPKDGTRSEKVNFFRSYVVLAKTIAALYRNPETRDTFWFLIASAVFRDGLGGVFTFGGVIAGSVFGFGFIELVIFGIAANLIAGVSTILAGRVDDRYGPKIVIVAALAIMIVTGLIVFFFANSGTTVFWIAGLALCACVGPAQSAARSALARVTPAGKQGEIFGLYATTGRATSWMSSLAWTLSIGIGGAAAYGILGICVVLIIGLLLLIPIRLSHRAAS